MLGFGLAFFSSQVHFFDQCEKARFDPLYQDFIEPIRTDLYRYAFDRCYESHRFCIKVPTDLNYRVVLHLLSRTCKEVKADSGIKIEMKLREKDRIVYCIVPRHAF